MRSRLARRVLFVAVQGIVVLLILEVGLRLARPHHDGLRTLLYSSTVRTEYDSVESTEELLETTGLGFDPGRIYHGFVANSRGFRTPEYTTSKPPGVYRVVVLGDSFTFASGGVPWSLMWHTRLGEILERESDREVEVINLGFPGVGPRFELRLWELEGRRLEADLVLLAFFIGNDFTDESDNPLASRPEQLLARWSATYRLARNGYRLWRERENGALEEPPPPPPAAPPAQSAGPLGQERPGYRARYDPDAPHLTEKRFLGIEWATSQILWREKRPRFERLLADVFPVLTRLDHSVETAGAEFAVMLIPDQYQIDETLLPRVFERFDGPREGIDLELPQRRLGELLDAEGIAYLDLLPAFRRRGEEERLYRPRDTHWNPAGNALAAEEVARFLARRGLTPRR